MHAYIESDWLLQNIHRWNGTITIQNQVVFET